MHDGIKPFALAVPETELDDLRRRLRATRWPGPATDASQGVELGDLQALCAYWAEEYDWRATEARLNAAGQFRTEIDALQIHFLHVRSSAPDAFPLILTHGWPGSVVEFLDVLEPLTTAGFDCVVPSLPGYGWSDQPAESGWGVERIAHAWAELMARLGYDRYGAQGGDWGAMVTSELALMDAEHLAGIHLNMLIALPPAEGIELSEQEQADLAAAMAFFETGSAYQQIQGKNPQTLGYGLSDSPAGLAGWIVEKFWAWTDHDGDLEEAVSRDALLTNLTVYWVTNTINSSIRLYCESQRSGRFGPAGKYVAVPTAAAVFPKEMFRVPRPYAERAFDLRRYTRFDRGGHFAALEEPDLLIDDVRAFFRDLR
jgi:epoxide hydrolase